MNEKTCFIIMPITTPESHLKIYRDGNAHFEHTLKSLIIPSIEKSGYKAITPIITGSEVIQSEIIKNLETSDLVLCDISTLNANVFFELGIRTSFNKPTIIIKDNLLKKVPFDINPNNYFEYNYELNSWEKDNEIDKLVKHIKRTNIEQNALWKIFGIKNKAASPEKDITQNDELKLILNEVLSLKREIRDLPFIQNLEYVKPQISRELVRILKNNIISVSWDEAGRFCFVLVEGDFEISESVAEKVSDLEKFYNVVIEIQNP